MAASVPASGNDPAFTVDGISNTLFQTADLTVTVPGNSGQRHQVQGSQQRVEFYG